MWFSVQALGSTTSSKKMNKRRKKREKGERKKQEKFKKQLIGATEKKGKELMMCG